MNGGIMSRIAVYIITGLLLSPLKGICSSIPFDEARTYELVYNVFVPAMKAKADADSQSGELSLWIPFPAEHRFQQVKDYTVSSPLKWKITREKKYGNRMVYIYGNASALPMEVSIRFVVKRSPYSGIAKEEVNRLAYADPSMYLTPLTVTAGYSRIVKLAKSTAKGLKSDSDKIKAFYNYVVDNLRYDKSGTGWGRGDPVWACSNKRGNCTDFHSLFIEMAKVEKIPARFKIGLPMPPEKKEGKVPGYHCWAEAYDSSFGWKPLDATEAKKTGLKDRYLGLLPSNRIEFSQGRNLILEPPQKGAPLNYFIFPYAEVGGRPLKGIKHEITFKRL
ncbi:MAG: transglutaminase domain-containing protein [Candidatus Dadabacteria bacterium]|nr:MAG: transglutaminase domain-containing protein [Candidatus Dadabacteria bacterium]